MKYTDKTDTTTAIALFEYGQLRRPDTGKTIFCLNPNEEHTKDNKPIIATITILLNDVKEALNEVDDGYFSFIGSERDTELDSLDNDYLTGHIRSLNMWNGCFINSLID